MTITEAISQRIKKLMKEKNITQDILEKRSKIKHKVMEDILNAKYEDIDLDIIYKICKGTGIKLADFFEDELLCWNNLEF